MFGQASGKIENLLDFRLLRIDEAILPFMNGDSITDVPEQFSDAELVEYRRNNVVYNVPISNNSTWAEVFTAFDHVLQLSGEVHRLDLGGVTKHNKRLRPIWI